MNTIINTRNYSLSGNVRSEIEDRFDKLEKYLWDDSKATVTVIGEKNQLKKVEISLKIKNNILRSEVADYDIRTAIDKALDKIEKQLLKHRKKLQVKSPDSIRYESADFDMQSEPSRIVRNKRFELQPMSAEEACFQLELLEHTFYVFTNEESGNINVVYKREDGDYGLIEPLETE